MPVFSSLYTGYLDTELGTDDSTVLFTTARRKAAVNLGIKEFAALTECQQQRITVTITGGTQEYNLNSTAIVPNGDFDGFTKEGVVFTYTDASSNVTKLGGDDLPRRDVHWLDRYRPGWQSDTTASTVRQTPEFWYVRPSGASLFLGFTPRPCTGSSASASFTLPYLAQHVVLTSDSQYPFTVGGSPRLDLTRYHQAVVHYAAHHLEKLRKDDAASDRQLQKFLGYVQRYWQDARIKGGRAIMTARNYFERQRDVRADPRT